MTPCGTSTKHTVKTRTCFMSKLQSFLEEFCRNTSTQEDKWYSSSSLVLFFKEIQSLLFTEDNFIITVIAFNIVHVDRNFNLQNVNIITIFGKFFNHIINLVWFYLGIFCTLCIINICVI